MTSPLSRPSPARHGAANPRPKLFAVGGAHIDRRGRMTAPFVPGASIPGTMAEETGGGAFNAIRAAVQRGVHATLMSVRGADSAGEMVAQAITEFGIADMSAVFLDRATPSYTALVDRDGEVLAGLADMALYETAFPKQLRRSKVREAVAEADAIFCDANLPRAALETLTALGVGKPIYAIAISPAKATRLTGLLDRLACLYMNMREASALAGMSAGKDTHGDAETLARALQKRGLKSGVITAGAERITGFDGNGIFVLTPPKPRRVADATGAGDALAGATTAAMMRGLPLRAALREGMAAAMLTIESPGAVVRIPEAVLTEALALIAEPEPA